MILRSVWRLSRSCWILNRSCTFPCASFPSVNACVATWSPASFTIPRFCFWTSPLLELDVIARLRIRDFIGRINWETGATVVLTTHDLKEIVKLCRRGMIIDKGGIIYDGLLEGLLDRDITFQFLEAFEPSSLRQLTDYDGQVFDLKGCLRKSGAQV